MNYIESSQAHLEQEIAEIQEKINLLSAQAEAKCPLCETELGSDGLNRIQVKYAADREGKDKSLKQNQFELAGRKS